MIVFQRTNLKCGSCLTMKKDLRGVKLFGGREGDSLEVRQPTDRLI